MKRDLTKKLENWKNKPTRKPLIIFGARQVGKTWLMKNFGKVFFENTIYLNFERDPILKNIFQENLKPENIIKSIEIYSQQKIETGKTLLIFDEIQEVEGALSSLKYFQEELPHLHILAAGSLLGLSLKHKTSFPVGKVEFLHLHPMTFLEFLDAINFEDYRQLIENKDWKMMELFKDKFQKVLKEYYFIGGMPEVVKNYVENQNFDEVRDVQNNILLAYEQDFSKHAPGNIIPKIRMVWNNAVAQLAKENKKFVYGLVKEGSRAKEFENALDWLEDYGLMKRVYRINKAAFPLTAYKDLKSFKIFLLDIGLLGAMANLNSKSIIEKEALFQEFKGALTEQYASQQLYALGNMNLHYWSNDSGNAEIDFIFEKDNIIYPLEVKAAENLQAKSLKTFYEQHKNIHCYRTSLSNYRKEDWMTNIPLIGISQI
jgi:uncharacterized protein